MNINILTILIITVFFWNLAVCEDDDIDFMIQSLEVSGGSDFEILSVPEDIKRKNMYIVRLDDDISPQEMEKVEKILSKASGKVKSKYSRVFNGWSVEFDDDIPLSTLRRVPYIKYVEEDRTIGTSQVQTQDAGNELWGLDSLDGISLDETYKFNLTGEGVNIYIVDTPVATEHPEFGGRAKSIFTASGVDGKCSGHGTHVAGIAAGATAGVAKKAKIFSLGVLGCSSGSGTDVIAAIDHVIENHKKPAVINLSLGPSGNRPDSISRSFARALEKAVENGITVAIAAGNQNQDGCFQTPASASGVLAIASIDKQMRRSEFSNYGKCVFMFAPGSDIVAADSEGGFTLKSGTSMSTPFVAGTAALHLQNDPNMSPQQVRDALRANALEGKVTDDKGSANLILQSVFASPGGQAKLPDSENLLLVDVLSPPLLPQNFGTNDNPVLRDSLVYTGLTLALVIFCGSLVYVKLRKNGQIANERGEKEFDEEAQFEEVIGEAKELPEVPDDDNDAEEVGVDTQWQFDETENSVNEIPENSSNITQNIEDASRISLPAIRHVSLNLGIVESSLDTINAEEQTVPKQELPTIPESPASISKIP